MFVCHYMCLNYMYMYNHWDMLPLFHMQQCTIVLMLCSLQSYMQHTNSRYWMLSGNNLLRMMYISW